MRAPKHPFFTGLALAALALAGCAVGPNYKRPAVDTPTAYRGQDSAGQPSLADLAWWDVYKDPRLNDLIRTAFATGSITAGLARQGTRVTARPAARSTSLP